MPTDILDKIIESNTKLTPMMEQYFAIKKQHPEDFVFFRMGDFYELFFDDAKLISQLLNITLTHRGKLGEFPIAMAGIPHHSAPAYIDRITEEGFRVVICEQLEDPATTKGIVKRGVTQIVGPGIPFDFDRTDQIETRFIACANTLSSNSFQLILLDFSSGLFFGQIFKEEMELLEQLLLHAPREFILFKNQWSEFPLIQDYLSKKGLVKNYLAKEYFQAEHNFKSLNKIIPNFQDDKILKSFPELLSPLSAISFYITSTQLLENYNHLNSFQFFNNLDLLHVSLSTLIGLEILPKSKQDYAQSLLGICDFTCTPMGQRELKLMMTRPLRDLKKIQMRQKKIAFLIKNQDFLQEIRALLPQIKGIEKSLTKLSILKASPQDIHYLKQSILEFKRFAEKNLNNLKNYPEKDLQNFLSSQFSSLLKIAKVIENTLSEEVDADFESGTLIKSKFSSERDKFSKLTVSAQDEITKLEEKYRKETGINNLKIKSNNISGLFIEVSKGNISKVPEKFNRLQTLTNGERYTTGQLEKFEKEINSAKDELLRIEREIFQELCKKILSLSLDFSEFIKCLTIIDVTQSLSNLAIEYNFACPSLDPNVKKLKIEGAFHPLVKCNLKTPFTPHDIDLNDEKYFALITGPNMAGKTTVMRELAIIQLLAQIGSYVPAKNAELGVCDYLFARLGANDYILKGQSTFMVEMIETAEIVRHATNRSFLILDEVGRGTSTYDGLSLASALVEYFINTTKCITLFSTHYHELISLVEENNSAKNLSVATQVENNKVNFLYHLIEKGSEQSFGIFVAECAGIPKNIIKRAQEILSNLEHRPIDPPIKNKSDKNFKRKIIKPDDMQLSFFN